MNYIPLLLWLSWVILNTSILHLSSWMDVLGFAVACILTLEKQK